MIAMVMRLSVLVAVLSPWVSCACAQSEQAVGAVLHVRTNGLILTDVRLRLPSAEKPADGQPFFEYDGGQYILPGQDLFVVTPPRKFVDGDVLFFRFKYAGVYSYTNAAGETVTLRACGPSGPIQYFKGQFIGPVYRGWHPAATNDPPRKHRGTNVVVHVRVKSCQ